MFLAHNSLQSLRVLFLLAPILFSAQAAHSTEPPLWKFNVGDIHPLRVSQTMKMDMDMGSIGKIHAGIQQTTDFLWTVVSVNTNGSASLRQKVQRVQMEMNAPGQTQMHYDSDSKEPPTGYGAMIVPMMKTLMDSRIQIQLSGRGELLSLEIPKKLVETMDRVPGTKLMGDLSSEKGLRNMLRNVVIVLPDIEDLQIGHQWNQVNAMENPMHGSITSRTSYTYTGPRDIEGQIMEVFEPKMETIYEVTDLPGGGKLSVLSQESSGEILFNRTLGRLHSSLHNNVAVLQIENAGQTMQQTLTQKVKVTRRDSQETSEKPSEETNAID